jgi:hypothetical protein
VELYATVNLPATKLRVGGPLWVTLTITNRSDHSVPVPNPDVGSPDAGSRPSRLEWTYGPETYQVAVLRSFHLLSLSVADSDGNQLPDIGPNPWTTPVMKPKVPLAPGDSVQLRINLRDFVEVDADGVYRVELSYGTEGERVSAHVDLLVHPSA